MNTEIVKELIQENQDEAIALFEALHRQPELSGDEEETSKLIAQKLRAQGVYVTDRFGGGYGLRGVISGPKKGGAVVLLRADMDALGIQEETGLVYASERPGIMHACGHDAHMATVWLAASVLAKLRNELTGSVVLMYQPHEELLPGGAKAMIDAGILNFPPVDCGLAVHTDPTLEAGEIGLTDGTMMARPDEFTLSVVGQGGHAAIPDKVHDPIVAASAVIMALQQVVSRRISPIEPGVISVCSIHGGSSHNVIPGRVVLKGTTRSLSNEQGEMLKNETVRVAEQVAKAYGCYVEVADGGWVKGYPPLENASKVNDAMRRAIEPFEVDVKDFCMPIMGGEDFAYVCAEVPSALVRLGSGMGDVSTRAPWHNPGYLVDERAIPIGATALVAGTLQLMGNAVPAR